ncbi:MULTISPECIES: hypothetical protein [Arenibacter]|uniref:hypothetical protein n=1 Tax=Arenibacter TaxID=178469 RepID=UPI000A3BCF2D|nr:MULTISPECIES: hypothetical protein [Arenibacter]
MKYLKKVAKPSALLTLLLLAIASCKPSPEPAPTPVKAPAQIVSVAQAKQMYDAYGERRVGLIERFENEQSPEKKFDVARFGSYDYQTIKDYLNYIEQEAKKANVEISTLRFYFSNYPDQETFKDGRKIKHPKQNSFFLIPTTKDDKKEDYAFYIQEDDAGNRTPILLTNNLNPKKKGNATPSQEQDNEKMEASMLPNFTNKTLFAKNTSLILNEADMTPPPYTEN